MNMKDQSSLKIVINKKKKMMIMKVIPMTNNMKTNSSSTNWRSIEIAYLIRIITLDPTLS